ncbi:hypothetical protein P4234_15460 [Pseudomonas aeruginosa]|nr:hypothetical protein [Pseudomonas aeruginosa]
MGFFRGDDRVLRAGHEAHQHVARQLPRQRLAAAQQQRQPAQQGPAG